MKDKHMILSISHPFVHGLKLWSKCSHVSVAHFPFADLPSNILCSLDSYYQLGNRQQ